MLLTAFRFAQGIHQSNCYATDNLTIYGWDNGAGGFAIPTTLSRPPRQPAACSPLEQRERELGAVHCVRDVLYQPHHLQGPRLTR